MLNEKKELFLKNAMTAYKDFFGTSLTQDNLNEILLRELMARKDAFWHSWLNGAQISNQELAQWCSQKGSEESISYSHRVSAKIYKTTEAQRIYQRRYYQRKKTKNLKDPLA